ncbi:MAG: hypothetical protein KF861_08225 [Planctomycetaceae bacterium]|nr:hypothetical protein [Planctomycetaceae bacterium]
MIAKFLLRFLSGLRFPWLFAVTAALFLTDLVVPDFFPFVDELLLGSATLLLGAWRVQKSTKRHVPVAGDDGRVAKSPS